MDTLFLLQFACFIITAMLALMLAASRLQMPCVNRHYEQSRWMLCAAMSLLAVHFVVQMKFGLRASCDETGAVVNILFYTPIAFLVSYGIFNVECTQSRRNFYLWVGSLDYLLILAAFATGHFLYGGIRIGPMLYVMLGLFVAVLLLYIVATHREIFRNHRSIVTQTGADMMPYDRYAWSSYAMVCLSVLALTVAILSRPLLLVVGPLMLLSLFMFTVCFIGFGYNIRHIDVLLSAEEADGGDTLPESDDASVPPAAQDGFASRISAALDAWRAGGGFRDSDANMVSLSRSTGIDRKELSTYFDNCLGCNFRQWLSDLRVQEAQRMLCEHPEFSNDVVSAECGFSSRSHLYRVFKDKVGMTPGQWRDARQSGVR